MAGWESWTALVGGLLAIVGQFWGGSGDTNIYLPLIGGVLAAIGGFGAMKSN